MVSVDQDKCIGCGACAALCPEVFEMKEGKSYIKDSGACDKCDCKQVADSCPVDAITV